MVVAPCSPTADGRRLLEGSTRDGESPRPTAPGPARSPSRPDDQRSGDRPCARPRRLRRPRLASAAALSDLLEVLAETWRDKPDAPRVWEAGARVAARVLGPDHDP